jgi:ribonuclease J
MINLTRPRYVFPFHGDHKRIHLHAEMAQEIGIEPKRIFKGRNGRTLEIDDEGARWGKDIESGMIFVDGVDIGDPDDVALRDRRTLSADGVLIVVITVAPDGEGTIALPELIFRGVPFIEAEEQAELVEELRDVVADTVADAGTAAARDQGLLEQDVHDDVAKFVYKRLKRRPMILPVVVEV